MSKSRDKHPFEENPFADDLLEWMGSAEGQARIDMSDVICAPLGDVQLDAVQRTLVWPDAGRLSFDDSVQRICKQHADFEREDVREFLLSWLENYAPEGCTAEQMNELDRLANAWAEDLRNRNG
jgi:hypothetical protein